MRSDDARLQYGDTPPVQRIQSHYATENRRQHPDLLPAQRIQSAVAKICRKSSVYIPSIRLGTSDVLKAAAIPSTNIPASEVFPSDDSASGTSQPSTEDPPTEGMESTSDQVESCWANGVDAVIRKK